MGHRFKFDPHAPSFVPGNRFVRLWEDVLEPRPPVEPFNAGFSMNDLPEETISLILERLPNPADVARLACCCRSLKRSVETSFLRLCVRPPRVPGPCELQVLQRQLSFISKSCTRTTLLDMRDTLVNDTHLAAALAALPALQVLRVDGCRKLQATAVGVVRRAAAARGGPPSAAAAARPLRAVTLQRCFQLNDASLLEALALGWLPGGRLSCVTLSHISLAALSAAQVEAAVAGVRASDRAEDGGGAFQLDAACEDPAADDAAAGGEAGRAPGRSQLRVSGLTLALAARASSSTSSRQASSASTGGRGDAHPPAMPQQPRLLQSPRHVPTSSLTALALNCCEALDLGGLHALATAAPALECLFLGGCRLVAPTDAAIDALPPAWRHARCVATRAACDVQSVAKRGNCCGDASPASSTPSASSSPVTLMSFCRAASRSPPPASPPPRSASASSPATEGIAAIEARTVRLAADVVTAAAFLPRLRVLELTHMPRGFAPLVSRTLQASDLCGAGPSACLAAVDVWDLCTLESAAAAAAAAAAAGPASPEALAIAAAAACSSGLRFTPLHCAAADGGAALAALLLRLGAKVDVRSKAGATPLFHACEAGHADVAQLLLDAGADMWLRTGHGENCLYIAALRGHSQVVERLLAHCERTRAPWQDASLYGDRWTPLMSSVVAGHAEIASRLLAAAGAAAAQLASSANRYGQTALHLAARRGSVPVLSMLLDVVSRAEISKRDASGCTPLQVAQRNHHAKAVEFMSARMCRV